MEVKDYSAPVEESVLLVTEIYGIAGDHLKGFCTPDCWGWSDEIGGPTMILGQTGNQGHESGSPRWRDI